MDNIYKSEMWTKEAGKIIFEYSELYKISQKYTLHRDNGPALIHYHNNGNIKEESWFQNGKTHNPNGPAFVSYYENGFKKEEKWSSFKSNSMSTLHQEDGPAVIMYYENHKNVKMYEIWAVDGKYSNYRGPAIVQYLPDGVIDTNTCEYYINGKIYEEHDWKTEVSKQMLDLL